MPSRSSTIWSALSGRPHGWLASETSGPMHVTFVVRGTGSGRVAADYLFDERDAAGQPRAGVEVLRGDPEQVVAVADSLEFEHKYRSAVIEETTPSRFTTTAPLWRFVFACLAATIVWMNTAAHARFLAPESQLQSTRRPVTARLMRQCASDATRWRRGPSIAAGGVRPTGQPSDWRPGNLMAGEHRSSDSDVGGSLRTGSRSSAPASVASGP